jgi:hypothetical protein
VERISLATARPAEVERLELAAAVSLTFRGVRVEHVRDRDTWVLTDVEKHEDVEDQPAF